MVLFYHTHIKLFFLYRSINCIINFIFIIIRRLLWFYFNLVYVYLWVLKYPFKKIYNCYLGEKEDIYVIISLWSYENFPFIFRQPKENNHLFAILHILEIQNKVYSFDAYQSRKNPLYLQNKLFEIFLPTKKRLSN